MNSAEATHSFFVPLSGDAKSQDWFMTKLKERLRIDVCNQVHPHTRLSLHQSGIREDSWVAKSGVARLQLKKVDKGLQFMISPDLNIIASLDFVHFYRSCLNACGELAPSQERLTEYTRLQPSFVLQSMGESSAHAAINEQLFLYQRCADELILLVINAVYFLEQTVQRIDADGALSDANLRKYLHALYVHLDSERLEDIVGTEGGELALIAHAQMLPHSYTVTDSQMGFDFTRATIETRLTEQGYQSKVSGNLQVWTKGGSKSVGCCFISCHTASHLRLFQQESIAKGVSVSRKELAPWLTFEQGRQAITSIFGALQSDPTPLKVQARAEITGIAAQYLYPEGCSAIFITASIDPLGDYSLYSPILLGRTVQSPAFTIQMFSDRVEANGPFSAFAR